MTEKFEFGSPPWLERLLAMSQQRAAADPAQKRTACEVLLSAPPHIATDEQGRLIWTITVENGRATMTHEECPDEAADRKTVADYTAMLPLARWVIAADNFREVGKFMREAAEAGTIRIVKQGDGPYDPAVHNAMAEITL